MPYDPTRERDDGCRRGEHVNEERGILEVARIEIAAQDAQSQPDNARLVRPCIRVRQTERETQKRKTARGP